MITRLFESEFSFDIDDEYDEEETQPITHSSTIGLGRYTWSKIGKIDGHDLYLCDKVIKKMQFSSNNSGDWKKSDIREWLINNIYNNLPNNEKQEIIKNEDGDYIFLLSENEFFKFKENIKSTYMFWLRTPCPIPYPGGRNKGKYAFPTGGSVDNIGVNDDDIGVRPAILLR